MPLLSCWGACGEDTPAAAAWRRALAAVFGIQVLNIYIYIYIYI
jgi:hypothetical protein